MKTIVAYKNAFNTVANRSDSVSSALKLKVAGKLLELVRKKYPDQNVREEAVKLAGKIDSFIRATKPGPETYVLC